MRRSFFFIFFLIECSILSAAPIQSQKKNGASKKYEYYNQIIINDSDFSIKVSLLDEETLFYDEYILEPNDVYILKEKLLIETTNSKKLFIQNPNIYIASIKYLSSNEAIYFLKGIKRNPDTKYQTQDSWNVFEDEDEEVFVLETPSYSEPLSDTVIDDAPVETLEQVQTIFNTVVDDLRQEDIVLQPAQTFELVEPDKDAVTVEVESIDAAKTVEQVETVVPVEVEKPVEAVEPVEVEKPVEAVEPVEVDQPVETENTNYQPVRKRNAIPVQPKFSDDSTDEEL